ncbi:uncharacterized protein F5891DRAFT_1214782 [Suillus fuscotomentosus]|uniref:Uncharacterized protein n=1 Tax=Suillus fuscotomentosus TaxID=1912939 RepID=A0AAD4HDW3_9AGAM|nr:uncharacterized protein F5891DRAFT_1214782 [Suillus fuscotomentosus]KAG1889599.1 hypothetical protein F5891DRAFT_1214782 [Suillus fuscotomentosus]
MSACMASSWPARFLTLCSSGNGVRDIHGMKLTKRLDDIIQESSALKSHPLKLTKRLDDIIQESSALKSHLVQQLKNLSNAVPELVNFDISLAQQVIPHLSDARSAKAPFQLATVLSYARQTATSTVAKDMKPGTSCFEAVGEAIAQLSAECNKLLPLAMEPENVFKSRLLLALIFVKYHANDGQVSGTPPWVLRIEEIRARMTTNVEAEQKAAQLQEEIQGLSRSLKTKDQVIQKSEVKIEHMERRMEAVKEQVDTIGDLDIELSKARKQEHAYKEAMEQL